MAEESTPLVNIGAITVAPIYLNQPLAVRGERSIASLPASPAAVNSPFGFEGVRCRGAVTIPGAAVAANIIVTFYRGPNGTGLSPIGGLSEGAVAAAGTLTLPFDFVDLQPFAAPGAQYSIGVTSSVAQTNGACLIVASFMIW